MKITLELPVNLLWNYREFNRISKPAPRFAFLKRSSISDLSKGIAKEGLQEPIDLAIYNGKALINDGNHRLAIYKINQTGTIPVTVTFYDNASATNDFYEHSLRRFRKINTELLNLLTPIAG